MEPPPSKVLQINGPRKNPDVRPVETLSWRTYRAVVGDVWKPGMNTPFDPVVAALADEHDLEVVAIGCSSLDELHKYLHDKKFAGSRITNACGKEDGIDCL